MGNAHSPNAILMFGDLLGDEIGGEEGPRHADKRVVFGDTGSLAGEPAIGAVGVASFGIILQKVDAAAVRVTINAPCLKPKFNRRRHAEADIVGADV